jgi:hypothetical protein
MDGEREGGREKEGEREGGREKEGERQGDEWGWERERDREREGGRDRVGEKGLMTVTVGKESVQAVIKVVLVVV